MSLVRVPNTGVLCHASMDVVPVYLLIIVPVATLGILRD